MVSGFVDLPSVEWMTMPMSNSETAKSDALGIRVTDLSARMQAARITEREMETFQKVAAIMVDSNGRIQGDDLIAASFVTDTPDANRPE